MISNDVCVGFEFADGDVMLGVFLSVFVIGL